MKETQCIQNKLVTIKIPKDQVYRPNIGNDDHLVNDYWSVDMNGDFSISVFVLEFEKYDLFTSRVKVFCENYLEAPNQTTTGVGILIINSEPFSNYKFSLFGLRSIKLDSANIQVIESISPATAELLWEGLSVGNSDQQKILANYRVQERRRSNLLSLARNRLLLFVNKEQVSRSVYTTLSFGSLMIVLSVLKFSTVMPLIQSIFILSAVMWLYIRDRNHQIIAQIGIDIEHLRFAKYTIEEYYSVQKLSVLDPMVEVLKDKLDADQLPFDSEISFFFDPNTKQKVEKIFDLKIDSDLVLFFKWEYCVLSIFVVSDPFNNKEVIHSFSWAWTKEHAFEKPGQTSSQYLDLTHLKSSWIHT